jgi:hypothetical protein
VNKFLMTLAVMMLCTNSVNATEPFDMRSLAWLEGVWIGTQGAVAMEEHWTSADGGALLGMHRDIKNRRMVSFEFMRIDTTRDGTFFFGSPRGSTPTPFKLLTAGNKDVTFENKEHDFPQRIRYWLDDAGALHASIEGTQNGKVSRQEWAWSRRKSK